MKLGILILSLLRLRKALMVKWVSSQAFSHYSNWECVQAGYWNGFGCKHDQSQMSVDVLTNRFADSIKTVLLLRPCSSAVHLSNLGINRRAWLGQTACFLECGNCADCTIEAWFTLTTLEQNIANEIASHWIASWIAVNSKKETCQQRSGQLVLAF